MTKVVKKHILGAQKPTSGDIAQLVERTDRTREARGSNPLISKFLFHSLRRLRIRSVVSLPLQHYIRRTIMIEYYSFTH